jgi:hypothetical protein
MGVDMYIEPIASRQLEACEAKFYEAVKAHDHDRVIELGRVMWNPEFHFRDSYGPKSLWRALGIDFEPYLNNYGVYDAKFGKYGTVSMLEGAGLARFIAEVESHPVPFKREDHDYFVEKRERLLRFLKRAYAAGDYIRVSY